MQAQNLARIIWCRDFSAELGGDTNDALDELCVAFRGHSVRVIRNILGSEPHMSPDLEELIPPGTAARGRLKAFVPVILGCDYGCTFCIVPRQFHARSLNIPSRQEDC